MVVERTPHLAGRPARTLVALLIARRLVRKPVAAVPQRRLERLRRAGEAPQVRPVALALWAAVPAPVARVAMAEDRPLGRRLWLPRAEEYHLEDPVGRAGQMRRPHLRWPALALALHARARAREAGVSLRRTQPRDLAAHAMVRSLAV